MFKSGYLLSYWWTLKVRSCLCDFCCIYKYSFFVSSFPFLRNMQHREQVPRSHEIQLVNFFLWLSKNLSKANDEFHLFLSESNTVINLMWSIEVPFLHVDFKFPTFHLATIGFLWTIKNILFVYVSALYSVVLICLFSFPPCSLSMAAVNHKSWNHIKYSLHICSSKLFWLLQFPDFPF